MEWGRLFSGSLLAGAALFSIGVLFHVAIPFIVPQLEQEYRNDLLFRPWDGWTRTYMAVHPLVFGVLFTGVFLLGRAHVGAVNLGGVRDGVLYGVAVFLVGSFPTYA